MEESKWEMTMHDKLRLFICAHGHRNAHECGGDMCEEMAPDEVWDYCCRMEQDNRKRILLAYRFGMKVGMAQMTGKRLRCTTCNMDITEADMGKHGECSIEKGD